MANKFYITTTLPYVNAEPHIGFAREIIQADVLARFHRALGEEVFFNTGTDEHGLKVFQKAKELKKDPKEYAEELAKKFLALKKTLNLSFDNFIRTGDPHHMKAVQEFWKICDQKGYIYKKMYKIKYCVGCEMEKTDSELVKDCCPLHPNKELEIIEEENYFFKYSQFQKKLLKLYEKSDFVIPENRLKEIKTFVEGGIKDFSISRVKSKLPWGVPVPNDPEQVVYVWFDALVNYISVIGWPDDMEKFQKFWPAVQLAGKDNVRPQAAMWQAMLMAAGIPPSRQIFICGFISIDGRKMSKSLGNVITPKEMVAKFGIDGTRYLLLSSGGLFGEDADFNWRKFTEKYNADLANGLGNLLARVIKLSQISNFKFQISNQVQSSNDKFLDLVEKLELSQALNNVWKIIQEDDKYIDDNKPWELIKANQKKFTEVMKKLMSDLAQVAEQLIPFLPETAEKIKHALETKEPIILFPRIK